MKKKYFSPKMETHDMGVRVLDTINVSMPVGNNQVLGVGGNTGIGYGMGYGGGDGAHSRSSSFWDDDEE